MFNRLVSIQGHLANFKLDLSELEAYVGMRYHNAFGMPPLEVEARKYPGEIDITICVDKLDDQKHDFGVAIQRELNLQGIEALVVIEPRTS